jgi:hypothetical protein
MDGDTTTASVTPIDVRCRQPGCPCERSVPGTLVQDGLRWRPRRGPGAPPAGTPGRSMSTWG